MKTTIYTHTTINEKTQNTVIRNLRNVRRSNRNRNQKVNQPTKEQKPNTINHMAQLFVNVD